MIGQFMWEFGLNFFFVSVAIGMSCALGVGCAVFAVATRSQFLGALLAILAVSIVAVILTITGGLRIWL